MFMIEREKLCWMVIIQLPCAKILTRANWKVFTRSNHPANRLQDEKNVFLSVTQATRKKKILVLLTTFWLLQLNLFRSTATLGAEVSGRGCGESQCLPSPCTAFSQSLSVNSLR